MKVQRSKNRLYKIALHTTQPVCLVANLDDKAWMWHARLGHVSFRVIEWMVQKDLVRGVPNIKHPTQVCEGCTIAKQTRQPFPKETQWRASKPLELVHADLCGQTTEAGNRYFMLLVDDYSRYMWVFMIKSKDEAFITFKRFKDQVEKESSVKLMGLRTDRGGEFTSQQFTNFCSQEGIRRQLTAPYSPQQNGVAERSNRSILEVTRSLLKTMKVPDTLWGEAVRHAVYILNRIPTKGVKSMTPYEGLKGNKPTLHHLKVFGCVRYVKKPTNQVTKLSNRSTPMVYLGVEPGSKAYRMFNPRENKLAVARDVVFDEKKRWDWVIAQNSETTPNGSWISVPVDPNIVHGESNRDGGTHQAEVNLPQSPKFASPIASPELGESSKVNSSMAGVPNSSTEILPNVISSVFDHTPVRGFRKLTDIFN